MADKDRLAASPQSVGLDRGAFTLSLDFELIWGTVDLFGAEGFGRACRAEREVVIDRLLDLLAEFDIAATWFIVGHLMLDKCDGRHEEIVRPAHAWHRGDWFKHDPGGTETDAPEFLGRSLVEKILACRVRQEVGCHSFSHAIFGDAGCSREAAESELAACVKAAADLGVTMRSFAFPRNMVGHLDLLGRYGFDCYRGPEPEWRGWQYAPSPLRRAWNFTQVLFAARPPVVLPEEGGGLLNVPASMLYFPAHGVRRHVPHSLRVKRALKGLDAAARRKRVFHLWFHPTNFAEQTEEMFAGLRQVFERVASLRARGELSVMPVGGFAPAAAFSAAGRSGVI